uniref:Uncharacterized protein n=1 Tax=Vespula pensylvanica TaxID=30213 RepID=A0A834P641_VESPE|nr:hypothetical protein H0235_006020 [Vespula pensylvanica]
MLVELERENGNASSSGSTTTIIDKARRDEYIAVPLQTKTVGSKLCYSPGRAFGEGFRGSSESTLADARENHHPIRIDVVYQPRACWERREGGGNKEAEEAEEAEEEEEEEEGS